MTSDDAADLRRTTVAAESRGPSSPLAVRAFRWLWSAALVSNVGVWMESVMAGFVMTQMTHTPSLVAAVPVALALPGVFFALAAGAAADAADRRLVLLLAKSLFFAGTLGLATLTLVGGLSPFALLFFTALLGTLATFASPAWWSTLHELVPERLLGAALTMDGVQWNVGQILGPVLGGVLLATVGAGGMFGVAAGLMTSVVAFLFVWRGRSRSRLTTPGEGAAERMLGAVAAGLRYLANAPALQVACWRTLLFVLPAGALPALLPLFAARQLGVGAIGYGALLSCVGVGSVLGALLLLRLGEHLHLDAMLGGASLVSAGGTVAVLLVHQRMLAGLFLAATGGAWLVAVTALNLGVQQAVPAWVLSRSLGAYLTVFQGSLAAGGLLWGGLADGVGVRMALLVAAAALVPGIVLIRWLGLPVVDRRDLQIVARPQPEVSMELEDADGPVMILVHYFVDADAHESFIEAMEDLRVVRRRTGATRWTVFEDAARPGQFIESFVVPSWGGYIRQRGRYTAADLRVLEAAAALHIGAGEPYVEYFIHPDSVVAYRRLARWRRLRGHDSALVHHEADADADAE
ncbi:MAG: MFS transporter [Acidimicrobiales bacterium]|jgi:MFS family permease